MKINPDYIYFAYDIVLDNQGLRLDQYEIFLATNAEKERAYIPKLVSSEYPEDLPATISSLRNHSLGYLSINNFYSNSFDIETLNPLTLLHMHQLARKNLLLEKVYDDKAISAEGANTITRYIHYINTETGIEYVEIIDTIPYSDENIASLANSGYKPIESSPIMNYLSEISKGKPTVIKSGAESRQA